MRVIVTGMVGLYPVGGVAWDYLQYAIGLARLGHDVYYHEDTWNWPYHPVQNRATPEGDYSAEFIANFFARYAPDLADRWHYLHLHEVSYGMSRAVFDEVARTADLFLNVSGACPFPDNLSPRCVKAFLDTDPGYNQFVLSERYEWSPNVERWCELVAQHDQHLTYAENIHAPDCTIPRLGFTWHTTRMPVVTDLWEAVGPPCVPATAPWTTVMTWNAFKGKVTYRGAEYTSKGTEFERLVGLPRRVAAALQVAVGGAGVPFDRLTDGGWQVLDGPAVSRTPEQYQRFIGNSRGEVSSAKQIYVATRSGWFSCRTACYLAAGRPAVVQDTGYTQYIPTGQGLLAFADLDGAARGIEAVEADYPAHQEAARELARTHFDSGRVLGDLLSRVGLG